MRKIVIYVVVCSDAGKAPGVDSVEGDKSRESAGRKHEEEREAECQQTFSSDAARKPIFTLAFTQEDTRVGSYLAVSSG